MAKDINGNETLTVYQSAFAVMSVPNHQFAKRPEKTIRITSIVYSSDRRSGSIKFSH